MSESTETAEAKTGRGRPRPEATIERDKTVLTWLGEHGPATRKTIVEGTGIPGNEVYLSLYRLSRAGTIVKNGASWSVVAVENAETPAETEAPAEATTETPAEASTAE